MMRLALALLLVPTAGIAQIITPVAQLRYVDASCSVSEPQGSGSDSENNQAPDFGPFQDVAGAGLYLGDSGVSATGEQTSDIGPSSLQALGQHSANGWTYDGTASAQGTSEFDVTFTLNVACDYTLSGWIEAFDRGWTSIRFSGPVDPIYVNDAAGWHSPCSQQGALTPGDYRLVISSSGSIFAAGNGGYMDDYSSGAYDIDLSFTGPVSAPLSGASVPMVAPNPFRGTTRIHVPGQGASTRVLVLDAAGRRVTRLRDAAGGTVVWDGRDSAGRSVPAGVYFLKISRGTWEQTARVTRLR